MEPVYVVEKHRCSGCLACQHICPVNAISVIVDKEGFKYPKINRDKCIECGKCRTFCANDRKNIEYFKQPIAVIGAKAKNEMERITSRSGGIFYVMAKYILEKNGAVYGCKLGNDLEVYHSRATTIEEINKFKGSKYVKSDLKKVYKEVKEDLKNNKIVLFSGTGCEVAGLNSILKDTNTENLYTCDLICHGAPSPLIYKEYIKFMEDKLNDQLLYIDFRDKSYGWSSHKETLVFGKNRMTTDYYTSLFYSHYALRPSCYNCQFTNMDRISDVTIGDFWGIDKENKEFYDEMGVSLALINTEKGRNLINSIKGYIDWIIVNSNNYKQPRLCGKSSSEPKDREKFWEEYEKNGFQYIIEKYAGYREEQEEVNRNELLNY